jgi:hypothetical protein
VGEMLILLLLLAHLSAHLLVRTNGTEYFLDSFYSLKKLGVLVSDLPNWRFCRQVI